MQANNIKRNTYPTTHDGNLSPYDKNPNLNYPTKNDLYKNLTNPQPHDPCESGCIYRNCQEEGKERYCQGEGCSAYLGTYCAYHNPVQCGKH